MFDYDKKAILLVNTTITGARQVYRNSECIHVAYIYIPFDSSNQIIINCVYVDKTTYHVFKHLISNVNFFQLDSENQNLQVDRIKYCYIKNV